MKNFFNRLMYGKSNKQDLTQQDMQEKTKVQLFFEILGVKYMELIKLNLIMIVFLIPTIVWTYMNFSLILGDTAAGTNPIYMIIYFAGLVPCLLIYAPSLGGAAYIIRNFTQDRHAWLWSDFWERTKENMKQSLGYMLTFSLFLLIGQIVLQMYNSIGAQSGLLIFARALFIVIYVFVILSTIYVYPMIVTYDLKLKDIIRNSLLLSIGKLGGTIIFSLLAVTPIIILLLLSMVWGIFLLILGLYTLLIGITFAMYVHITYTTDTFEQYLSQKSEDEEENAEQE